MPEKKVYYIRETETTVAKDETHNQRNFAQQTAGKKLKQR